MEREFLEEQQRLITTLTQTLSSKDVQIDKFRGYENEDISRWFQKLELQLEAKRIQTTDPIAISQVVSNLSGPAETFLFELQSCERKDYASLKQALQRRYSTKDRAWVRRQRLVSLKQGQHEPLSDYINEMHELFSGLEIGEAEKVTYFTEGLHQSLKIKVLERMPATLFEAEEIARTVDSISRRINQSSNEESLEKMLTALLDLNQNKSATDNHDRPTRTEDQKTLESTVEEILQRKTANEDAVLTKLESYINEKISKSQGNSAGKNTTSLAAVSESSKLQDVLDEIRRIESKMEENMEQKNREMDAKLQILEVEERYRSFRDGYAASLATFSEPSQRESRDYMREIHQMEHKFKELSRRVDARINGLARKNFPNREEPPRQHTRREQRGQRTRRGRPICYKCGRAGHIQYNCYNYNQPEDLHQNHEESTNNGLGTKQEGNMLRPNRKVQQKITARLCNVPSLRNSDANLTSRDLTTEGKIAGQSVQLLVDTGACVSAIDKEFFTKIYGQFPPTMSQGSISAVQTVSGDTVPILGKITVPLLLNGREYSCQFHVIENLTYDAILGRDFLQENRALIDLNTSSITFQGDKRPVKHIRSAMTTPVMGTFFPQSQSVVVKKTEAQLAEPENWQKNIKAKLTQRSQKHNGLVFQQPLLVLMLILLYLFANSCTLQMNYSNKPVIKKLPNSFVHENADHKVEDVQKNYISAHQIPNGKELDQSVLNVKEAKREDISKSYDAQAVQNALKSSYSSPYTVDQDLKKGFEMIDALNVIKAHHGNDEPRY